MSINSEINKPNRLIFIGGAPRSGTSLLQKVMDSHPNILGPPEFDHIPLILELRRKLLQAVDLGRIDQICTSEQINRAVAKLIEDLLLPIADKKNCVYLSEKTPWNVLVYSDIIEVLPSAQIINIVRDPRAVVSSMLDIGIRGKRLNVRTPRFARKLAAAIQVVGECLNQSYTSILNYPDRIITVCYEDLVDDPTGVTKKICSRLDIKWDATMIKPESVYHSSVDLTQDTNTPWLTTHVDGPVSVDGIDKWKERLSSFQVYIINRLLGKNEELIRNGYQLLDQKKNPVWLMTARLRYVHFLAGREISSLLLQLWRKTRNYFKSKTRYAPEEQLIPPQRQLDL